MKILLQRNTLAVYIGAHLIFYGPLYRKILLQQLYFLPELRMVFEISYLPLENFIVFFFCPHGFNRSDKFISIIIVKMKSGGNRPGIKLEIGGIQHPVRVYFRLENQGYLFSLFRFSKGGKRPFCRFQYSPCASCCRPAFSDGLKTYSGDGLFVLSSFHPYFGYSK